LTQIAIWGALVGIVVILTALVLVIMYQLRGLHLTMNSRLDELLQSTKSLARAEGFKAGQKNHLDEIRDVGRHLDAK
jgi:hypothetical protein